MTTCKISLTRATISEVPLFLNSLFDLTGEISKSEIVMKIEGISLASLVDVQVPRY